jgi:hypothetical protein
MEVGSMGQQGFSPSNIRNPAWQEEYQAPFLNLT